MNWNNLSKRLNNLSDLVKEYKSPAISKSLKHWYDVLKIQNLE